MLVLKKFVFPYGCCQAGPIARRFIKKLTYAGFAAVVVLFGTDLQTTFVPWHDDARSFWHEYSCTYLLLSSPHETWSEGLSRTTLTGATYYEYNTWFCGVALIFM